MGASERRIREAIACSNKRPARNRAAENALRVIRSALLLSRASLTSINPAVQMLPAPIMFLTVLLTPTSSPPPALVTATTAVNMPLRNLTNPSLEMTPSCPTNKSNPSLNLLLFLPFKKTLTPPKNVSKSASPKSFSNLRGYQRVSNGRIRVCERSRLRLSLIVVRDTRYAIRHVSVRSSPLPSGSGLAPSVRSSYRVARPALLLYIRSRRSCKNVRSKNLMHPLTPAHQPTKPLHNLPLHPLTPPPKALQHPPNLPQSQPRHYLTNSVNPPDSSRRHSDPQRFETRRLREVKRHPPPQLPARVPHHPDVFHDVPCRRRPLPEVEKLEVGAGLVPAGVVPGAEGVEVDVAVDGAGGGDVVGGVVGDGLGGPGG